MPARSGGRRRAAAGCTTRGPNTPSSGYGGRAGAATCSATCSTRCLCRSTGPSRSTASRRRPTAPGSLPARGKTSNCRPSHTGMPCVTRSRRQSRTTSPTGSGHQAISIWNTGRRARRSTRFRRGNSATSSATSGSGLARRSCPSRASRCIRSMTTSRCRPSTAATT